MSLAWGGRRMHLGHRRSLLAYFALWVVAPLSVAMIALASASLLIHQEVVSALLLDRDSEMAMLAADNVRHEIQEYTRALEDASRDRGLLAADKEARRDALRQAASDVQALYAGLEVLDAGGHVLDLAMPATVTQLARIAVSQRQVPSADQPFASLSDVALDPDTGANYVVIGVPLRDDAGAFAGALLGIVAMQGALMTELIAELTIGESGFAYLVDRRGRVVFHRDVRMAGADVSGLPFMQRLTAGESSGLFWTSPGGEQLIVDYAPVRNIGWGVITQEPWDVATAPVRQQGLRLLLVGVAAILASLALLWWGVRRIVTPLEWLAEQSARLAADGPIEPAKQTGIIEIDVLGTTFDRMVAQIHAYRASLRRYAGFITQTLEEERRHIARELHDETVQNLFAIARRIEVHQADADSLAFRAQLAELRGSVTAAMQGVRQIIRDLRPRLLEDLGLIPAVDLLLQDTFAHGAPHVTLDVIGQPRPLDSKLELTIYRVVQEATTNVRKHAQADAVAVKLIFEPQRVHLEIHDDGRGFVAPATLTDLIHTGHFGLIGMQERAWSAGGQLTIHSASGQGVKLLMTLPTPDPAK